MIDPELRHLNHVDELERVRDGLDLFADAVLLERLELEDHESDHAPAPVCDRRAREPVAGMRRVAWTGTILMLVLWVAVGLTLIAAPAASSATVADLRSEARADLNRLGLELDRGERLELVDAYVRVNRHRTLKASGTAHWNYANLVAYVHCAWQVANPGPCQSWAPETFWLVAGWAGILAESRILWRNDRGDAYRVWSCRRWIVTIDADSNGAPENWQATARLDNLVRVPYQPNCHPWI